MNTFNAKVVFKLDTGAEATAITEKTYNSLPNVVLKKPQKILQGPTKQHLNVLGQFTTTLSHGPKSTIQTIYVINGHKTNLLGLPARVVGKGGYGRTRTWTRTRTQTFSKRTFTFI